MESQFGFEPSGEASAAAAVNVEVLHGQLTVYRWWKNPQSPEGPDFHVLPPVHRVLASMFMAEPALVIFQELGNPSPHLPSHLACSPWQCLKCSWLF
jgi:hypothetical protein